MAERRLGLLQSLRERLPVSTLALGLAVALAAALTVNLGHSPTEYKVGQTLGRAVTARVPFRIPDPQLTQSRRIQARDNSPNYYQLDAALLEDLRGRLTSVLTLARTYADEPERLTDEAAKIRIVLDEAARAELSRLATGDNATEYQQAVDRVLELLRAQPLVEASDLAGRRTSTNAILMDPDRQTEQSVHINNLRVADAETIASVAEAAAAPLPAPLRPSIQQSLTRLLSEGAAPRGLYRFDRALTAQKGEEARDAIPEQFTEFPANAVLADGGPISREEHALLGAEHAAYIAQRAANSRWPWGADLGRAILAFVVVASVVGNFAMVGVKQRPNVVRQVVTAGAMVALLLAARLVYVHAQTLPAQVTLAPLALAAALLAIVYRRPGLVYPLIITLALLITISTRRGLEFLFVQLATATALAALLRDVRNRGQIVGAGVVAAVVAGFMTAVAGLIQTQTGPYILWIAGWAAGATLAAAFVVEGILPAIERAFKTSTSMTLLEWCDANKPLLRMMAAEAPGTYNHSLLVGALGEAAAESIGANGLLCRAGAYYHDIGKINKPEYFVENQAMRPNRHDRLSPAMSLLIIIGHVKDGIEMAREYGLPESLRPFIAEHHGTTLVEYFYHAANKARRPDDPELSDTEFRYPGPKPQTRETAIIMLCDGVEGAVRAMAEPTPGRIEDVVTGLTEKRLADGQFDECDLTFRELGVIKQSLIKSLCAIYHSRIAYPSQDAGRPPEPRRGLGA